MTKKEVKQELWKLGNLETLSKEEANELLDKIYDDFEKELKEMEQKLKDNKDV